MSTSPSTKGSSAKRKRDIKSESKHPKDLVDPSIAKKIDIKLMLANVYDPEKVDPTGWYMSEKLDGVRCYFDG